MFQSTPAIAGGRSQAGQGQGGRHASFNPRPPLLAGDPVAAQLIDSARVVSIHARHCWRAIRLSHWALLWISTFQSTPAIAGGRSLAATIMSDVGIKFQSTPAIAGGRSRGHCHRSAGDICFNPRPPLLAGDPPFLSEQTMITLVSIHARHCWRAILVSIDEIERKAQVSIHARHCWRAIHPKPPNHGGNGVFQSTPAIAGGRSHPARHLPHRRWRFNPRPPLLAGDPRICHQ